MVNKILLFFIIMVLSGTSLSAQGGNLYIKLKQENIRNSPNGDRIGLAYAGTQVEILERRSNWVKIQITGWIWSNSLTSDSTNVEGFSVRVSHILVGTEAEAKQILNRLKSGEKFDDIAKELSLHKESRSKGGDLGEFKRGDFALGEFEDAVFQLKKGEISGIIKTPLGYHIIKRTN